MEFIEGFTGFFNSVECGEVTAIFLIASVVAIVTCSLVVYVANKIESE